MSYGNRVVVATALDYARVGVPVAPAYPTVRASHLRSLLDPLLPGGSAERLSCGCGNAACDQPGAHPLQHNWAASLTTDAAVVRAVWDTPRPPNLVIATGGLIDAWIAPPRLGAAVIARLIQHPPDAWPPMLRAPSGHRLFLTASTSGPPPEITAYSHPGDTEAVRWHSDGDYVVVPPSRRPGWPTAWQWSAHFPHAALPDAEVLLAAVSTAAQDAKDARAAKDAAKRSEVGPSGRAASVTVGRVRRPRRARP